MNNETIGQLAKQAVNMAKTNGINNVDDMETFLRNVIGYACHIAEGDDHVSIIEGLDIHMFHMMQNLSK